ncbi:GNAT family N-acetyltransferase [Vibrio campbellii]|nr:GNAT family N-acetyltransferase [Vibrio campbellii]
MIREIKEDDFELFWPCFKQIIEEQETYAFDPTMKYQEAFELWCKAPLKTFVYVEGDQVLGSYYIRRNAEGPSSHICNCGFMVQGQSRGKGIAKKLCEHSLETAINLGFRAMQFNSVVSSNEVAVNLWKKLGFAIIGTIPLAYLHRKLGYVDSFIMHKTLVSEVEDSIVNVYS